jgi:CheY-like chemotaxis protein
VSAAAARGQVRLEVRDTGAGIAPEFLPHVFERFRQADASTTRAHSGLGLGLAIVRHLVELHGGAVEAQSAGTNQGAVFRVWLPVPLTDAPVPLAPAAASAEPVRLAGRRVLVVDDDPDTLALLVTVLRRSGAETCSAASAAAALEAFLAAGLPADGGGAVPAIALTAYARAEDRERALRSGFQAHLAKPVNPDDLITAIAALLTPAVSSPSAGRG